MTPLGLSTGDTGLDFYVHYHTPQNKVVVVAAMIVLPMSHLTNKSHFLSCVFWTTSHLNSRVSAPHTLSVERDVDTLDRLGFTGC